MTEEEAKQKWCPMMHEHYSVIEIREHPIPIDDKYFPVIKKIERNCIGSDCMMWRRQNVYSLAPKEYPPTIEGYCGLGGKP